MPSLNLNQFSYMTNKQSLSPVLDLNVGVIENEAVQFTSVLRKRRVKMNRHKLKKRRKKQRFLTRKATK
jgi:tRNA G10  N-methylase Trm11